MVAFMTAVVAFLMIYTIQDCRAISEGSKYPIQVTEPVIFMCFVYLLIDLILLYFRGFQVSYSGDSFLSVLCIY